MMIKNIKLNLFRTLLFCSTIFLISCNREFPNLLNKEYNTNENAGQANKVLVIVADGLRGTALNDIEPNNLRMISRNSLYSHSGLGDFTSNIYTKYSGLTNIFTGQTSKKHNVISDLNNLNTDNNPTLFTRLKTSYADFKSVAYTTDQNVYNILFEDVDTKSVLTTDAEVVSQAKDAVSNNNDASLIVAHLSEINKAGLENSFESTDINYKDAILKFDTQVQDLIDAVKNRPTFKNEKWLVIITSSIGGDISYVDPTDQTVYAQNMRNVFTYFYSPSFTRKYVAKPTTSSMPFTGSGIRSMLSDGANASSAALLDGSKLNFPSNQSFTINFFFKNNIVGSNHYYPAFFMKRSGIDNGTGWQFIIDGGNIQSAFSGNSPGKMKTDIVNDGKWHVITYVLDRSANRAAIYTDGKLSNSGTAGTTNITNTEPTYIGRHPNGGSASGDFTITNVQFYSKAFSDADVKEYAGLGYVTDDNSPYYNDLIAYYPFYDDNGSTRVTDVTGKYPSLSILNSISWASFEDFAPFIKPRITDDTYKLVPNLVDIPFFIYQWFGIVPSVNWSLDGQAWTPPYAILEY